MGPPRISSKPVPKASLKANKNEAIVRERFKTAQEQETQKLASQDDRKDRAKSIREQNEARRPRTSKQQRARHYSQLKKQMRVQERIQLEEKRAQENSEREKIRERLRNDPDFQERKRKFLEEGNPQFQFAPAKEGLRGLVPQMDPTIKKLFPQGIPSSRSIKINADLVPQLDQTVDKIISGRGLRIFPVEQRLKASIPPSTSSPQINLEPSYARVGAAAAGTGAIVGTLYATGSIIGGIGNFVGKVAAGTASYATGIVMSLSGTSLMIQQYVNEKSKALDDIS
ncbi:MAG: hypothetical protein V4691_03995 [Pseudomonadota bacterium]